MPDGIIGEEKAKLFALGGFERLSATHDKLQQVEKNKEIYDEYAHADPREPVKDLEDLPRKERSRDDEGKVLSPGVFQIQADAFGSADARVAEG